jgi:hypothetical protein
MTTMKSNIKLEQPSDWPRWFLNIEYHARLLDVWEIVDPDETMFSEKEMLGKVGRPDLREIAEDFSELHQHRFRLALLVWEGRNPDTRGERPTEPTAGAREDIADHYWAAIQCRRLREEGRVDAREVENVLRLHNLIASSVDDDIFYLVLCQLKCEGKHGVRAMLQTLRTWAAPTEDQQPEGSWEGEVCVEEGEEREEVPAEEGEEVLAGEGEEVWVEEGEDFCNQW